MAVELRFAGWFECRLATDDDLFDEKRGRLGWTFALPTEPDLDRIIRFQPTNAVQRWGGPPIGVRVTSVIVAGAAALSHPLVGAPVVLPSNPVFEGRNGTFAGNAREPVAPFEISVAAGFSCQGE